MQKTINLIRKIPQKTIAAITIILGIGFFLKTTTNLGYDQITLVIIMSIGIWLLKDIKYKIKYGGIAICWLGIGFLLLIGTLPLFQKNPSLNIFKQTKTITYNVIASTTGDQILLENKATTRTILIKETFQNIYPWEYTEMTFSILNKYPKENSILYIQFPGNTTIALRYGAKITIKKEESNRTIKKQLWSIEYVIWDDKNINIIDNDNNEQKEKNSFVGKYIIDSYSKEQKDFVIKQMWGITMTYQTIRQINKSLLDLANKIRPKKYNQNLKNYEEYKNLLKWKNQEKSSYTPINDEIEDHMKSEADRGLWETMILKNIFN